MAIILSTTIAGIEVQDAYARVEDFIGPKEGMDVTLVYYVNKTACQNKEPAFKKEVYPFVPDVSDDAPNYHKQVYFMLKDEPQFADAIDA